MSLMGSNTHQNPELALLNLLQLRRLRKLRLVLKPVLRVLLVV